MVDKIFALYNETCVLIYWMVYVYSYQVWGYWAFDVSRCA